MAELRADLIQLNKHWFWMILQKDDALQPAFHLKEKSIAYDSRQQAEAALLNSIYAAVWLSQNPRKDPGT